MGCCCLRVVVVAEGGVLEEFCCLLVRRDLEVDCSSLDSSSSLLVVLDDVGRGCVCLLIFPREDRLKETLDLDINAWMLGLDVSNSALSGVEVVVVVVGGIEMVVGGIEFVVGGTGLVVVSVGVVLL